MQGGVPYYETSIDSRVTGSLYHNVMETSFDARGEGSKTQSVRSLHMSLLVLKEKVGEFESYLSFFLAQESHYPAQAQLVDQPSNSMAFSSMANLMHIIVETASCMMLNCQQMALESSTQATNMNNVNVNNNNNECHMHVDQEPYRMPNAFDGVDKGYDEAILNGDNFYSWYNPNTTYNNNNNNNITVGTTSSTATIEEEANEGDAAVVEVDAEDLLARYTHYCQVCGRGFKREANLRMHMRAHGSSALMSNNPMKKKVSNEDNTAPRKYSCPQEGCRWNKNHVNFQPLKSMVCVKNHYKRSHCPKMFVCKRCNTKEFSVLSDLKTHEKHCGEIKWYCSCGISFSKKDKLMDHVAMFFGHTPLNTSTYQFGQTP